MKRSSVIIGIVLCIAFFEIDGGNTERANKYAHFKQYIIGLHLLTNNKELTNEKKLAYYKQLTKITSITSDSAFSILKEFENKPKKWISFIDTIIEFLHDSNTFIKE